MYCMSISAGRLKSCACHFIRLRKIWCIQPARCEICLLRHADYLFIGVPYEWDFSEEPIAVDSWHLFAQPQGRGVHRHGRGNPAESPEQVTSPKRAVPQPQSTS
jgi:hypothetical protein